MKYIHNIHHPSYTVYIQLLMRTPYCFPETNYEDNINCQKKIIIILKTVQIQGAETQESLRQGQRSEVTGGEVRLCSDYISVNKPHLLQHWGRDRISQKTIISCCRQISLPH